MTADRDARRHKVRVLSAVQAAAADPLRLLEAVQEAADDEDALRRVGEVFDLDDELSQVLLDLQVRHLSIGSRSRLADELRLLRAEEDLPMTGPAGAAGDPT